MDSVVVAWRSSLRRFGLVGLSMLLCQHVMKSRRPSGWAKEMLTFLAMQEWGLMEQCRVSPRQLKLGAMPP